MLSLCASRALAVWLGLSGAAVAQPAPQFTGYQFLTTREMLLRLSASNGLDYRIDASTNLAQWNGLLTLLSTGMYQHTDSAAPYLASRYYRALQLIGTNHVTGDHLVTTNGDVVIHPVNHASLALSWNSKMIYVDPANKSFSGLPKADLILFSHDHSDHFNAGATSGYTNTNATIIAPQIVYNGLASYPSLRSLTTVLTNGMSTNALGLLIEAVPAYNFTAPNHPRGVGNGYVLNIGGRRVYISGDTEDIPEMRALTNIDVAFLAMNRPYTMYVTQAVSAVRAFRPKVVYPYHYQPSSPATDLNYFKQEVMTNPGVEVRIRKWY